MPASPIYVEPEEEVSGVIERIGREPELDVPLVVPARSRFGRSRFNYQLLKQYTLRMGKRVTILSPDPAVQKMAQENGFSVSEGGGLPGPAAVTEPRLFPPPVPTVLPAAPPAPATPPPPTEFAAEPAWAEPVWDEPGPSPSPWTAGAATALEGLRGLSLPEGLRRMPRVARPGRLLLYAAAALILIVGLVAVVFLLPTADVTLVAQSTPFSTDVTTTADPGKPPIRVRAVTPAASASQSFNASGTKVQPGAVARGAVTFDAGGCSAFGFHIPNGTRLVGPGGVQFATNGGDVDVGGPGNPQSASTSIIATAPGESGNVPPGPLAFVNPGQGSCIQIQGAGTSGGTGDQKSTVISASDVSSARVALQQALQQKIQGDLSKAGQPGEKMNDQIQWTVWSFTTTHSPGDQAPNFTATMELRGEGDFYRPDDVTAAFTAALKQKVPADKQLVGAVMPAYQVTPAAGGHLTFAGKANGFVAPKLDLQAIKGKVAGKSAAQARQNLKSLPVQSATIQQHPFKLPFMPLFTSRVKVDYQLVSPPATSPSPPPSH